eukprot:1925249-Pyramimonas_sp.AAC.1
MPRCAGPRPWSPCGAARAPRAVCRAHRSAQTSDDAILFVRSPRGPDPHSLGVVVRPGSIFDGPRAP